MILAPTDIVKRDIREHMTILMKQNSVVDEATAATYENSIGNRNECCTAENFKIALTGVPRCPWNCSAAVVFARSFVALYGIDPQHGELKNIIKQVLIRIKGLFRKSKKGGLPVQAFKKINQRNRRTGRKETVCSSSASKYFTNAKLLQLFQKRLRTCMEHPLLQQHIDFIKHLGHTGMSRRQAQYENSLCMIYPSKMGWWNG